MFLQMVGPWDAFIIKWTKDYVYTHKILHPDDFEKWLHEL
jgi:hypothetical protein